LVNTKTFRTIYNCKSLVYTNFNMITTDKVTELFVFTYQNTIKKTFTTKVKVFLQNSKRYCQLISNHNVFNLIFRQSTLMPPPS